MNQVFVRNEVLTWAWFDLGESHASESVRRVLQRDGAVLEMARACGPGRDRARTTFAVEYFSIAHPKDAVTSLLRTSVRSGLPVSIEAIGGSRTKSGYYREEQDARTV